MDGIRIQKFFTNEVKSLLDVYKNFETLIPANSGKGAGHRGEDGRFVETLIRSLLSKFLPRELEVLTGFIVRPAVKRDTDKSRSNEKDSHSSQLDIIIYDSAHYPLYMKYENTAIVPPEGVIGIISVKKTLSDQDIENEIAALNNASKLCHDKNLRGPYLALIAIDSNIDKKNPDTFDWIFRKMKLYYENDDSLSFDDAIGYIGALENWSIFKRKPNSQKEFKAEYVVLEHRDEEPHLGLQFLLTGLLSVFYDKTRSNKTRPGFTAFPSERPHDRFLGEIDIKIPAKI